MSIVYLSDLVNTYAYWIGAITCLSGGAYLAIKMVRAAYRALRS